MKHKIDWSEVVYKDATGGGNDLTLWNVTVLLFEAIVGIYTICWAFAYVFVKGVPWLVEKCGDFCAWLKGKKESKEEED